jgi:hypothetical protein
MPLLERVVELQVQPETAETAGIPGQMDLAWVVVAEVPPERRGRAEAGSAVMVEMQALRQPVAPGRELLSGVETASIALPTV